MAAVRDMGHGWIAVSAEVIEGDDELAFWIGVAMEQSLTTVRNQSDNECNETISRSKPLNRTITMPSHGISSVGLTGFERGPRADPDKATIAR